MSKIPVSRLLEEINARPKSDRNSSWTNPDSPSTKTALTKVEKQEIWAVIEETSRVVGALISLLDSYDKKEDWEELYFWERSQGQLKKIRQLKNEATAWYFDIWEKIRIHNLTSDQKIQEYYSRVKWFKQSYHATEISSQQIRDFHENIKWLVVPLLKKAFK